MKPFAILAAALIALAPAAALARECNKETANICQDGFSWNAETQTCVEIVTG
ncbi:hypothetical protein [Sinisalibacter aestuarii]|uniref:Adenylosuccinate lyase n=1 Tax=Sinisalibacter aestuarii TaxID=2949426 RepID=A0ABQ5LS10_9RHOB|nr:hypothetical protein [Sinisalibacter aestuarii]GKY87781.1 hypothetical protein STA1M1_16500 [Sinisalibacter aestuarii]